MGRALQLTPGDVVYHMLNCANEEERIRGRESL